MTQGLSATVTLPPGDGTPAVSGVIGITNQLILQNAKKLRDEQEERQRDQNTALRHS